MSSSAVRVLIVDDHELFGDTLKLLLDHHPNVVTVLGIARDGEQAVELALRTRPDVVLMDVGLPGIDGFEAARRLLAAQKDVRVVAMTGRDEIEVRDEAREAGIVAYLSKDRIHEHVLAAIHDAAALPPL